MERCIEEAKRIINRQVVYKQIHNFGEAYSTYQKFFYWTNENVGGYLELADFAGKNSALTVASSGDQAFNLITKGITRIDTFDTNRLTEYFAFGLKRAMILKYSYQDFCIIMSKLRDLSSSLEFITDIIKGLFPYMESHHRVFWNCILEHNYDMQMEFGTNLNLLLMLSLEKEVDILRKGFNNYLNSELEYEVLRRNLGNANITFKNVNAAYLAANFQGLYDFILLSNIPSYFQKEWGLDWEYSKLQGYIRELEGITKDNGIIFLNYIMFYINNGKAKHILINDSLVDLDALQGEEVHKIKLDYLENVVDGMILKRVKKDGKDTNGKSH